MPNSGYFDVPFGQSGPLTTVPDGVQTDGSISYTQGYGPNYTLQPGTPGALNVDNATMNQVFNDITKAIQYNQQGLPAPFITTAMNNGTPYSYAQFAMVMQGGVAYQSNVSGNTDTPPSSKWNPVTLSSPNTFIAGTSTGSANAQVLASLSPAQGFSTAVNGQSITFTAGFTNSGSTTLAITSPSVPATVIKKLSGMSLVNLTGGEIVATNNVYVNWNLTNACWVLTTGPALGTMAPLNIGNNIANDTNGNAVATIPPLALTGATQTFSLGQWGANIQRSNAASAMTDTLPGTSGALPSGWFAIIENIDVSAVDTLSAGSGGSITLGEVTGPLLIFPGQSYLLTSKGSGIYTAFPMYSGLPNFYQSTPGNPTGTINTTGVMCGLAGSITPKFTGTVRAIIAANLGQTQNAPDGTAIQIRYGTGAAPANGAALTGTAIGAQAVIELPTGADQSNGTCIATISGLTVGTTYWFDLSQRSGLGGLTIVLSPSVNLEELK